jgi:hypothetical protein
MIHVSHGGLTPDGVEWFVVQDRPAGSDQPRRLREAGRTVIALDAVPFQPEWEPVTDPRLIRALEALERIADVEQVIHGPLLEDCCQYAGKVAAELRAQVSA